jgi:hypothetical protein
MSEWLQVIGALVVGFVLLLLLAAAFLRGRQ